VADVDTGGVPYELFAYVGLLPWTFFSESVSTGSTSLVSNLSLLNKVYCPREVFPLASTGVAATDTAVALVILGGLFGVNAFAPKATAVWIPVLLLVQLAFTLGVALIISSIVVYLRDLRHVLPVLLQLGLFATPVAYGLDAVPGSLHWLYALLNPLAPVIDGYRRAILLGHAPDWSLLGLGALSATVVLAGGYLLFKRLETGIADVA
jgi:ABC-type polysaccharide/polyol phosphate export permease